MPSHKDLKRLVRSRMKKTGEAYTAARVQVLKPGPRTSHAKSEPSSSEDYARLAGLADTSVLEAHRPDVGRVGSGARRGGRD